MKKILFGGSFDPIHLGHTNMANCASQQFDADVIFLPTAAAVWKKESTPVEHKIKMVELAIKDYPRFKIDLYEVNKGEEQNYSIDTVKYFVSKYPDDQFYYLIGSDQVNAFHRWKDAKELSELVQIIYFSRPDYQLDQKNIEEYHMQLVVGIEKQISSTDIRSLKTLELDKRVIDYIVSNNLYFVSKIRSLLSERRFNHSVNVANLAYDIAVKNNIDHPERAFIAGILHDISKEIPNKEEIMVEHYKEYGDLPKFAYHQFASEYIARKEFGIEDKDILQAIEFHATGTDDMCELAKIIYAADKTDPSRGYDSSKLIQAMMDDVDLGFKTVLQANKDFLENNRKDINNRLTLKCFNQYLK